MTAALEKHFSTRPFIVKCFEASTAHISKEDDRLLSDNTVGGLGVYKYEYGYFVYTGVGEYDEKEFEAIKKEGYSDALINLVKLAIKNGCKFLQLDCDGFVYEDLPKFDW